MKKIIAAISLSLLALGASAERADSLKQTELEFDSGDVDSVSGVRTIWGDVVLKRGTLVLKSDRAIVKESPEGYLHVTLLADSGKVATFRQKQDGGPDLWVEGQAERIEYDDRAEVVQMFSKAMVRELEGGKMTNQLNAAHISYNNRTEEVAVRNDVSGQTKPGGGRSTMTLMPKRKAPKGG